MKIKKYIASIIAQKLNLHISSVEKLVTFPQEGEHGDFTIPCFHFAKVFSKTPSSISAELAESVVRDAFIADVRAVGPYLNFFMHRSMLAQSILEDLVQAGESFGLLDDGQGKVIVVDYSSPNIAKPFHVGHFSATIYGATMDRLLRTLGYKTIRINHLGDWGTQFGKLIVAYKRWWRDTDADSSPFAQLLKIYVQFHKEAETNPELENEARDWFRRLEAGDAEALKIWEYFRTISLNDFKRLYTILGAEFDSFAGEAFYSDKIGGLLDLLKEKSLLELSEGAQVVRLDDEGMPPCIVLKSDGASIYATRDLAAAIYRHAEYHFDRMLYLVGQEQSLHFKQIFAVLKKMGFAWAKDCEHISYGIVRLPGRKMSTRKGDVVLVDDLLSDAYAQALAVIEEKNPKLPDKKTIAHDIGLGAIVYTLFKSGRKKDVTLNWEESLSFEGESGPYLQYAHVRCLSVLRKATLMPLPPPDFSLLIHDEEIQLIKLLALFPETLQVAGSQYEPAVLVRYLTDLAKAFNKFYHLHSILMDLDVTLVSSRVELVRKLQQVFHRGFNIMGLPVIQSM